MKPAALILADLLEQAGVETVVCSPGSRNAPLIAALEEKPLKLLDIIDERAAAFVALGIARQSRKRVAMVCTSGTALLNYAPAVAEAFYQGVPLVVVSADRPMQWIDQDDSQTIRQAGALGNIVKGSFDIPDFPGSDAEMCWYASRTVNEALLLAVSSKPGPVHLNFQFNEPLRSEASLEVAPRQVSLLSGKSSIPVTVGRELAKHLQDKRILLVAGFLPPDHKLSSILRRFITLPNVFLLPEVLSNLHIPPLWRHRPLHSRTEVRDAQGPPARRGDNHRRSAGQPESQGMAPLGPRIDGALGARHGLHPGRLLPTPQLENYRLARILLLAVRPGTCRAQADYRL